MRLGKQPVGDVARTAARAHCRTRRGAAQTAARRRSAARRRGKRRAASSAGPGRAGPGRVAFVQAAIGGQGAGAARRFGQIGCDPIRRTAPSRRRLSSRDRSRDRRSRRSRWGGAVLARPTRRACRANRRRGGAGRALEPARPCRPGLAGTASPPPDASTGLRPGRRQAVRRGLSEPCSTRRAASACRARYALLPCAAGGAHCLHDARAAAPEGARGWPLRAALCPGPALSKSLCPGPTRPAPSGPD
jgi:hypothetical protein